MSSTRCVTDSLEALRPYIKTAAVDELALRLCGLSGEAHFIECLRLANAILAVMQTEGDVGAIEIAVVLATLQIASNQAAHMQVGHA